MNYKRIYDELMTSRLSLKPERYYARKNGEYYEGHHIIPKSKGGTGTSTAGLNNPNIVLLTAREHFLAHWLLWRIHGDRSSALAFHKMMSSNNHQVRNKSARGYEEARLAFSVTNKGNQYGKGVKRVISEETKKKISENHYDVSGSNNPFYGKNHSQETLKKMSENHHDVSGVNNPKYKGLKSIYKNGIFVAMFNTAQEIADFIGCSYSNVRHVLSGKQETAKGYQITHGYDDRLAKFNTYKSILIV